MIMNRFVGFLALFTLLCGGMASGRDDAASKKAARRELKLMSFNIRYYKPGADGDNCWENRREGVLKMLRAEDPDIIGFQEPHRPQVDFLRVGMNDYASLDMGRDADTDIEKRPDGGEHLMILYRKSRFILLDSGFFWLSDTPQRASRGWDAVCRRVTVWGKFRDRRTGREFYYFDTHFDHKGVNARKQESRIMIAKMKEIAGEKAAVIMSGSECRIRQRVPRSAARMDVGSARDGSRDRLAAYIQRLGSVRPLDRPHLLSSVEDHGV